MKKSVFRLVFIASLIIVTLAILPTGVFAADTGWNTGETVNIDLKKNPIPTWLQIFSPGVKIEEATTICYPFDRGRHLWVGKIYELKNGNWIKLPTTMKWMPTPEGHYSACADTKEAGIYAILGYYNGPTLTPTPTPDHLSGSWNTGIEVTINMSKYPAASWLQLLSRGVEVKGRTKICHPFNFGLHDWIGEIWQLKNGQWAKLSTTTVWLPNAEGTFSACANAPEAGTYALFGYMK